MESETFDEFKTRINQEIKNKGLKYPDKEYDALKQRIYFRKHGQVKQVCPHCGSCLSVRFLRKGHKCFNQFVLPTDEGSSDLKV
jgi:hypothetical protein